MTVPSSPIPNRGPGLDAFRPYGWGHLEEIDRLAATVVDSPGASDSDRLEALDLRRRVHQDRGDLVGYARALERASAQQDAEAAQLPDSGAGFLNVVSLDGTPTGVLPREFEAMGVIPPDTVVVVLDPDWQLPSAGIEVSNRDGKLKRGNTLLRCEPEDLEPFLTRRRAQRDERHAQAREARRLMAPLQSYADVNLIVDPEQAHRLRAPPPFLARVGTLRWDSLRLGPALVSVDPAEDYESHLVL